ncbi:hypothetical protein MUK42_10630 [Musa troglodytarum]|uniref:Uncharacterized protein n=1 Tax=Musa troglodytarum TaxID=320322 RepID=A0A9E7FFJ5_9LILI|nr:hypothetical protein MUK42_10630 [Musa troglodytarum]
MHSAADQLIGLACGGASHAAGSSGRRRRPSWHRKDWAEEGGEDVHDLWEMLRKTDPEIGRHSPACSMFHYTLTLKHVRLATKQNKYHNGDELFSGNYTFTSTS